MMESIIELISDSLPRMSKGHKAIANYIIESYDKAAYMTASKLGEETGVSESTVVRFTTELGFDGYPHFQSALKEELKSKLTSVQRLNYTERFDDDATAVRDIMKGDMDNLKDTIAGLDDDAMAKAVDAILKARKIYIMGLRSSSPLSSFTSDDVMIGISVPRYSQRTINSMEYAKKKGATIIAITDKDNTAMTEHADIKLFAKSSMASFVDSLAAPLSLINALLVTLGIHRRDHIRNSFESLELLWSQYEVYNGGKDKADRHNEEEINSHE